VRRTTLGFDTVDLVLDLVVAADSTWSLKDEDDFERAVSVGQLQQRTAEQVRAAAERMISVVEGGGPPFSEKNWPSWRPPSHWTVPALPANWASPAPERQR
jgi:predicted RNA-binding protein associated with RNAse of E/G family